jgi:predicted nucleic acid-binding protein
MPLLLDTGVLYALADEDDDWHDRCRALIRTNREPLLAPVTVIPEAACLIHSRLGAAAEQRLVQSIAARELNVEMLGDTDWKRSVALMAEYPDIGLVDASVVAIAERLRLTTIATTDRRDFRRIRPRHRPAFDLVP